MLLMWQSYMLLNNHGQILHCFPSVVENLGYSASQCFTLYTTQVQKNKSVLWVRVMSKDENHVTKWATVEGKMRDFNSNICRNKDLFYVYKCYDCKYPIFGKKKKKRRMDFWLIIKFYGPVVKSYTKSNCILNALVLEFSLIQTVSFCCCIRGNSKKKKQQTFF